MFKTLTRKDKYDFITMSFLGLLFGIWVAVGVDSIFEGDMWGILFIALGIAGGCLQSIFFMSRAVIISSRARLEEMDHLQKVLSEITTVLDPGVSFVVFVKETDSSEWSITDWEVENMPELSRAFPTSSFKIGLMSGD